jgi:hypothetical protein
MSRLPPPTTGTVTATAAADPVDFEEMAAEQSRCPETQRLLGGTSLKLAFHQTGAQRLAGDISTGNFLPIVPLKFRKDIFAHFHNVAHPGGSPPVVLFLPDSCGAVFPAISPPGPAMSGLPAGQDSSPHTPGPPTHPHPAATFFSSAC